MLSSLIDTGRTVSIIHTKKFDLLPMSIRETVSPTRCVLRMADGGPVGCKGTTFLPLCIGSKVYHQQVLIADIEAPFVLGYDFYMTSSVLWTSPKGNYSSQTRQ